MKYEANWEWEVRVLTGQEKERVWKELDSKTTILRYSGTFPNGHLLIVTTSACADILRWSRLNLHWRA